jgi:hypothetical protein
VTDATEPFDVYINGIQINSGPWDVTIELFLKETADAKDSPRLLGRVRMSPQHALILARLLQRQLDIYQEQIGRISLPPKLYNDLGLEE